MTVHIPGALRSYTKQQHAVEADGRTVGEVLSALDRRYPGLRFRIITEQDTIRPHIKIYLNETQVSTLATAVGSDDRVHIVCALSGG